MSLRRYVSLLFAKEEDRAGLISPFEIRPRGIGFRVCRMMPTRRDQSLAAAVAVVNIFRFLS